MRLKERATTQRMPADFITSRICSREEPQPKFSPATRISFGCRLCARSGLHDSKRFPANSSGGAPPPEVLPADDLVAADVVPEQPRSSFDHPASPPAVRYPSSAEQAATSGDAM